MTDESTNWPYAWTLQAYQEAARRFGDITAAMAAGAPADPAFPAAAVQALRAILAMHYPVEGTGLCFVCGYGPSPCKTVRPVLEAAGIVLDPVTGSRDDKPANTPPMGYIVATDQGLFGIWFDQPIAHARAESVEGVVLPVPIAGDYRGGGGTPPARRRPSPRRAEAPQ